MNYGNLDVTWFYDTTVHYVQIAVLFLTRTETHRVSQQHSIIISQTSRERSLHPNHRQLETVCSTLVEANLKENVKPPHHWPLVDSPHKGPVMRKNRHDYDVIIILPIMSYGRDDTDDKSVIFVIIELGSWLSVSLHDESCHDCTLVVTCFYKQSGRRKISWNLEAARFLFRLSNRSEIWEASRQQQCRDAPQISERCDHCSTQSRAASRFHGIWRYSQAARWAYPDLTDIVIFSLDSAAADIT